MPDSTATNVRKLTRQAAPRRETVAGCRLSGRFLLAIGVIITTSGAFADSAALEWQDPDDIAAAAEKFLLARLSRTDGNTRVVAGPLDRRLRLSACDHPPEGFLRAGTRIGPKTVVGVRCTAPRPWKIYVPVEVVVETRVWVARRPLPRGHLLSEDDIVADVRDVSRMTSGYVADAGRLLGQRLRSSVLAGRILTPGLLEADDLIARGQTVTLAIVTGDVSIRMSGKALMDGGLNQRIRVENLNSGRVVEGIVRSRELVEVLVPGSTGIPPENPKVPASGADTLTSNNDR